MLLYFDVFHDTDDFAEKPIGKVNKINKYLATLADILSFFLALPDYMQKIIIIFGTF